MKRDKVKKIAERYGIRGLTAKQAEQLKKDLSLIPSASYSPSNKFLEERDAEESEFRVLLHYAGSNQRENPTSPQQQRLPSNKTR